jgi:hypothetical protein
MISSTIWKVDSPVEALGITSSGKIGVHDFHGRIRFYVPDKLKPALVFRNPLHQKDLVVTERTPASFSPNADILVYDNQNHESVAISMSMKQSLFRMKPHRSGMDQALFFPKSNFFVCAAKDGHAFIFCAASGNKTEVLPAHSDSITAIGISSDERLIATAGYDRRINVTNRSYRSKSTKLITHGKTITSISFVSDYRLLSTDREGNVLIWSLDEQKVIKRFEKFNEHIINAHITQDETFLIVSAKNGYIGIYDFQTGALISRDFISVGDTITTSAYCQKRHYFVCGTFNGKICAFDFAESGKKLDEFFELGQYEECCDLLKKNPLAQSSETARALNELYEKRKQQAITLLSRDYIPHAEKLLEPFHPLVEKRKEIQKLFADYQHYKSFATAVKNKKYSVAYSLATTYTELQSTKLYQAMERQWEQAIDASTSTKEQTTSYRDYVRNLFKPFIGIPSKSKAINHLFNNAAMIQIFRKKVDEREFGHAIALSEKYIFLQQYPAYTKLHELGKSLEQSMIDAFYAGEYHDAAKIARELHTFKEYSESTKLIEERANVYAEAMDLYANKHFDKVFTLIEKHQYLAEADIGSALERRYRLATIKAEQYALKGNVAAIKTCMGNYARIRAKRSSILYLLKRAYYIQLNQVMRKKPSLMHRALSCYIELFGYDTELSELLSLTEYKQDEIYEKSYHKELTELPNNLHSTQ